MTNISRKRIISTGNSNSSSSGGGFTLNPTPIKTSAYNAIINDLVITNATAANIVITLPTAPTDKSIIAVKLIAVSSAFVTTINTGGTDVFNKSGGVTNLTLTLTNQSVLLQYQSSTGIWYVISDDLSLAQLDLRYANLVSPAFTGNPTVPTQVQGDNSTKIADTAYVDLAVSNAIAGLTPSLRVAAISNTVLPNTPIYSNGVSGVGATLTSSTNSVLIIDGYTPTVVGERVGIKNQVSAFQNGIYYVSQLGVAAVLPWILTRSLDYDQPTEINNSGAMEAVNGTINADTSWILTTTITTVGTDSLTYISFTVNPSLIALNTGKLSQFASTSSAELASVISDETGSNALVFANSPTLTGIPLAPTAALNTNTTQLATTAFVIAQITPNPTFNIYKFNTFS